MSVEPGQLWEYEDERTGWKFLALVADRATSVPTRSVNLLVLDWGEDYELDRPRWFVELDFDLEVWYKRVL
jgi:hypothetical protein